MGTNLPYDIELYVFTGYVKEAPDKQIQPLAEVIQCTNIEDANIIDAGVRAHLVKKMYPFKPVVLTLMIHPN